MADDLMLAGIELGEEMIPTLIAHRRRQASELRRFAIALRDHPDVPSIHARADRLEALAFRAERAF